MIQYQMMIKNKWQDVTIEYFSNNNGMKRIILDNEVLREYTD